MPNFGWFGEQDHRVFDYKPIYFDKEKEERRQMFGKVDGSMDGKDGDGKKPYAPGSYLQGAFRNGSYSRRKGSTKAQSVIGIVGLILVVVILFMIAKFYSLL